jgi:gamma-glutamylcyclotransferase (GGCT)/AIG2-like uncharacterized protein YtfP
MKKGDLVFVYGTLRRGERASLTKEFYQYGVTFVGEDIINGKMYHLGGFPGIKVTNIQFNDSDPRIHGEVFLIRDQSIIAVLDAYENYDEESPLNGMYDRVEVETFKGRPVWVYVYNGPVLEAQRIQSGDWCKNRELMVERRLMQ